MGKPLVTKARLKGIARRLVVPLVLLGVFALFRPGQAAQTLTSPRALLLIVAVLAAAAGLGLGVRRLTGKRWLSQVAQALPVLIAGVLFVLPMFRTSTVQEDLPTAAEIETAPAAMTGAAPSAGAAAQPMKKAADPVRVSTGDLRGTGHRASGAAAVYRLSDGSHLVRLENVDIEPGPGYGVYLVPGADRQDPKGGVRLAGLKATRGSHNYRVPASFRLSGEQTVLVWCEPFDVPIAVATQRSA